MIVGPSTQFGGNVNFIAPRLFLNGLTVVGTASLEKNGASDDAGTGGNIFQGITTITNSGSGYLLTGNTNADQFGATATFNVTGSGRISIRDLIKASLRMRPDRIVVGEVRGEEALDMLQAMNTGHDGSLSTGHANSTRDMLSRLETMVLSGSSGLPLDAVRQQIASAIDVMIHLARLRDRSRKTMEITEIVGYENGKIILNPLYVFEEDENTTLEKVSGKLKRTNNPMVNVDKLRLSGINTVI